MGITSSMSRSFDAGLSSFDIVSVRVSRIDTDKESGCRLYVRTISRPLPLQEGDLCFVSVYTHIVCESEQSSQVSKCPKSLSYLFGRIIFVLSPTTAGAL